jgi:competence protein ComEA
MNLRLPVILCIVGAAGVAAVTRAVHPPATSPPPVAFSQDEAVTPAREPSARVRPTADPGVVVYVAGAVARGGVYHLAARSRAVDAVRAAGGATASGDLVAVNLAAPLADGDEVIVPQKGAADDVVASDGSTPKHHKKHKRHRKRRHKRAQIATDSAVETADTTSMIGDAAPAAPIDINAADASELETLPGVGANLAERIVSYREQNGPFAALDDLLDVGGMTQKRLDDIEPFLVSL